MALLTDDNAVLAQIAGAVFTVICAMLYYQPVPVKSGVPVRVWIQVAGISLHISDTMIKYEKQQINFIGRV